jgi:short-subunit dehydrogenase
MTELRGKTVLVTGASAGLGAAVARQAAGAGARVALIARRGDRLDALAADIRAQGGEANAYVADVGDAAAVAAVAARIRNDLGVPDVIVNNAGAGVWRFMEEAPADLAASSMAAPYLGAYYTTHAFMTDMLARGSGHIVNVNSPVSRFLWPGATAYAAARWAMRGFSDALRADLAGTGLRVTHFVCGVIATDYFATNPGSEERLPRIEVLVPRSTPEQAARGLIRAVRGNRRDYVMPFMLWLFYLAHWLAPRPVAWLVAATGYRRRSA